MLNFSQVAIHEVSCHNAGYFSLVRPLSSTSDLMPWLCISSKTQWLCAGLFCTDWVSSCLR